VEIIHGKNPSGVLCHDLGGIAECHCNQAVHGSLNTPSIILPPSGYMHLLKKENSMKMAGIKK
jgi:hypothetical protein